MEQKKEIQNKFRQWLHLYFPNEETDSDLTKKLSLLPNKQITPEKKSAPSVSSSTSKDSLKFIGLITHPKLAPDGSMKVFENDSLIVYVLKSVHQRQKNFKFQDAMIHIKIEEKTNKGILLQDLMEILEETFKFILSHLKTFFSLQSHNIAYMCLFQSPMLNGLNTGTNNIYYKINKITYFSETN